jgi:SAM-dependent methyltransferase
MGLPPWEDLGIASAVHPASPNMTMGLMVGRDEHSLASRAFNECELQHLVSIPTRERGNKKETPMTEPGAQYDHIGSKYDEYARTATLKRAESYTVFRMVGALAGQRVLDLACGFGFYTRLFKQRGAAQVVGVDLSPEMVRLAQQQEHAEPLGITYQIGDAVALPPLGRFDLVTAVYLLNYAESQDQMLGMCRSAYDNLVEGGRFITYTVNPAFTLSKPNSTKYGVTMLRQIPDGDRYLCDMEFVTDPPTPYQHPQWSQATHEWAVTAAGFRAFAWHPSEVAPEDVAHYGEAYWRDFHDNCLVIGLVCQK